MGSGGCCVSSEAEPSELYNSMFAGRTHSEAEQVEDQAGRRTHGLGFNHFPFAVNEETSKSNLMHINR